MNKIDRYGDKIPKKIGLGYIDIDSVAIWCPNSWNMEGGSERQRHQPSLLVVLETMMQTRPTSYIRGGDHEVMECQECFDHYNVEIPHHLGKKDIKTDGR
jgi:hypothetical protein